MAKITLQFFGFIGSTGWYDEPSLDAKLVYDALAANPDATEIDVLINSGGGYVDEGFAIYNALIGSGKTINVLIVQNCFSIATVIAMAASPGQLKAYASSEGMIHPAWTYAEGNADDLEAQAAALRLQDEKIFNHYLTHRKDKLTITDEQLREFFNAETYMSAAKMLEIGFIDAIATVAVNGKHSRASHLQLYYNSKKAYALTSPKNTTEMALNEKDKTLMQNLFNSISTVLKTISGKSKNMNATLKDGSTTVTFDTDTIQIGSKAYTDEAMTTPLADGQYATMEDLPFTVSAGSVTSTDGAPITDSAELVAEKAKTADLETKLATSEAEKTALVADVAKIKTDFNALKALVQGDHDGEKPKGSTKQDGEATTRADQYLAYAREYSKK